MNQSYKQVDSHSLFLCATDLYRVPKRSVKTHQSATRWYILSLPRTWALWFILSQSHKHHSTAINPRSAIDKVDKLLGDLVFSWGLLTIHRIMHALIFQLQFVWQQRTSGQWIAVGPTWSSYQKVEVFNLYLIDYEHYLSQIRNVVEIKLELFQGKDTSVFPFWFLLLDLAQHSIQFLLPLLTLLWV